MYDGFGMGLGGGFMWIFWLLLILVLVWAIRAGTSRSDDQARHRTPRELLDERFARGEIEEEEYRKRRSELERP